jgi:hypothetical protein
MPRVVRGFQYFGITTDEQQRAERARRRAKEIDHALRRGGAVANRKLDQILNLHRSYASSRFRRTNV